MKVKPLNKKKSKNILEQISSEYGCDAKELMINYYSFFISEKNKVYIINNEIKHLNMDKLRINSFGLYFCELNRGNVRLSMEGSHIIGKHATKNVYNVSYKTSRDWLMGKDISCDDEFNGFVLVKNKEDILGCGKYKEGKILNYVPKQRRVNE